nr:1999_t:CDS:2 [Entrophospora candida]
MTISCKFEILNKICKSISDHGHNYRPNQTAFSERKSFQLKSTKYGANYSHFIYEYVLIDDSGSTIYEIDLTDKSLNDAKDCLLKNYLKVDITTSNKVIIGLCDQEPSDNNNYNKRSATQLFRILENYQINCFNWQASKRNQIVTANEFSFFDPNLVYNDVLILKNHAFKFKMNHEFRNAITNNDHKTFNNSNNSNSNSDSDIGNNLGYVNLDIKFLKYKGSTQYIDLWQISETDFLFNLNESPLTKKIKNNEFQVILYNYKDQQVRKQVAMADENLFLFRINYDDFNDRNDEKQPKQIRVSADIVDRKGNILKGFNLLLTKDEIIYLDVIDGVNGDDDKKMVAEEKNNINIYSYKGGGVSINFKDFIDQTIIPLLSNSQETFVYITKKIDLWMSFFVD